MHQSNCVSREGNSIELLAADVVGSVRTHDGRQESPGPKETRAETCYLSRRSWALVGAARQIVRPITASSAENRQARCLEKALDVVFVDAKKDGKMRVETYCQQPVWQESLVRREERGEEG